LLVIASSNLDSPKKERSRLSSSKSDRLQIEIITDIKNEQTIKIAKESWSKGFLNRSIRSAYSELGERFMSKFLQSLIR